MATEQMVVRRVEKKDWLGVLHVERNLTSPWDVQDHREFYDLERNTTLVATDGEYVHGFVCLTVLPREVEVVRLAVADGARRVGIGRGVLDAVAKFFVTPRRKAVTAVVSEYQLGEQLFLRACGFRVVKTIRWGDVADEYLFRRVSG